MISPFVPDASGVAAVPPGLGTMLLEISAVAGDFLAVGAPHYSIPALTGIINEKIITILHCLPSCSVSNTASPGGGDASGTHRSAAPDCRTTLYKVSLPFQGRDHLHSNPPYNATDSNVEVSRPTINIIGCQTSTTLLLQATADLPDLPT